jgi:hypothetical protein
MAAPEEVSPNTTSETMFELSISRPQAEQKPSVTGAEGFGHRGLGHDERSLLVERGAAGGDEAGSELIARSLSIRFLFRTSLIRSLEPAPLGRIWKPLGPLAEGLAGLMKEDMVDGNGISTM